MNTPYSHVGFLDMTNEELVSYIRRKLDSVEGRENHFTDVERHDYDAACSELKRRVGQDEFNWLMTQGA